MTTTTANTELRAFQKAVLAKIDEVASTTYWHGFDQIKRDLGLDNFVDDHEVTVKITVPATSPEEAQAAVSSLVERGRDFGHITSDWAVEVSA